MKTWQRTGLVAVLGVVAFLAAKPGEPSVSSDGAKALVQKGALLLDVRTPEEFASGHLEGAVNVPVQVIDTKFAELKVPADRPIVVYCRSGVRSAKARGWLEGQGYKAVHDLGSISNWK